MTYNMYYKLYKVDYRGAAAPKNQFGPCLMFYIVEI